MFFFFFFWNVLKIASCAHSNTTDGFCAGKPVAVTSNRGAGKVLHRPGANPQLEQQYYQWKQSHPKSGEDVITIVFTVENLNGILEVQILLHVFIDCNINIA